MNDYALQTIEDAVVRRKAWNMVSFLLPWREVPPVTNEVIIATFTEAMNVLSVEMQRLILEAEVSLNNLNQLEEGLATLHEIVVREDLSLAEVRNEVLASLWTFLGGNQRQLRGLDQHLFLLRGLGASRQRALAHVTAVFHALQSLSADMEDMRERVAAPELTAGRIPVEVHMKSIKSGLERLMEGRTKAKEMEQEAFQRLLDTPESAR